MPAMRYATKALWAAARAAHFESLADDARSELRRGTLRGRSAAQAHSGKRRLHAEAARYRALARRLEAEGK